MKYFSGLIIRQLKQGVSPEKLAQSIALGVVLGIIPLLGTVTFLTTLFALKMKLNQVAIHTVSNITYPLQFICLIPFFRMGEFIFSQKPLPLYIPELLSYFKTDFWAATQKYAATGAMGTFAWLLVAPVLYFFIFNLSQWLLNKVVRT